MGRTMAFCELCTRAHFFCFHQKIAVPCTILTLGPETSRCLRRPRWAVVWCSVNFSQKTFFFQFFFPRVLRASSPRVAAICRPWLRPKSAIFSRCLRRLRWAWPRCSFNFVHALTSSFFHRKIAVLWTSSPLGAVKSRCLKSDFWAKCANCPFKSPCY